MSMKNQCVFESSMTTRLRCHVGCLGFVVRAQQIVKIGISIRIQDSGEGRDVGRATRGGEYTRIQLRKNPASVSSSAEA